MTARIKPGHAKELLRQVEDGTLGAGSVAYGEYVEDMERARFLDDGSVRWVECCYCATPLEEERPYWEEHVELVRVQDAHSRKKCRHETGEEWWACSGCDCTARLEARMEGWGRPLLEVLRGGSGKR